MKSWRGFWRRHFRVALWSGTFLLLAPALPAAEKLPVINMQKNSWQVLFQGFVAQPDSEPPNSEIAKIIFFVDNSLQKLGDHILDDNEKQQLRQKAVQKELYKHYKEYNKLVEQRDRAALNATLQGRSLFGQITSQENEDKKINEKARLLKQLQNMEQNLIPLADSLPLKFTNRSGESFVPPNIILLKEDFDVFIWGVARGKDNIFQVEIWSYLAATQREVLLWQGIVGPDNYDQAVEMIKARTASLLLGRPWAALNVAVTTSNDSEAQIYLDGKLQGENNITVYGLSPRSYELEIMATGLQGRHFFVELQADKLNSFNFRLERELEEKYIEVSSSVPAEVYLGVRYLGTTPLRLRVPAYDTLLVLVAKNKRTVNYDLNPDQSDDLFFNLEVAPQITLQAENDKRRTSFYWSSALFMISLAIPVLASGVGFVNQGLYSNNKNNGTGAIYQQSMFIGFGVAIAGGILSGALLGLNIYDFTRYTKSTRALTTTEFKARKVSPAEAAVPQVAEDITKNLGAAATTESKTKKEK